MVMKKIKLQELRSLIENVISEAKEKKSEPLEVDYEEEAEKLIDRWGLDPDEMGWSKVISTFVTAHKGFAVKVDQEKLTDAINAAIEHRNHVLDRFIGTRKGKKK